MLLFAIAFVAAAAPSPPAPVGPYQVTHTTMTGGIGANGDKKVDVAYPVGQAAAGKKWV